MLKQDQEARYQYMYKIQCTRREVPCRSRQAQHWEAPMAANCCCRPDRLLSAKEEASASLEAPQHLVREDQ